MRERGGVLVLGAASWNTLIYTDTLPGRPATVFDARRVEAAGSTGLGKALAVQALGTRAALHCVLGADDAAQRIQDFAAARALELIVDIDPSAPTPQHLNLMDAKGGRVSYLLEMGPAVPCLNLEAIVPRIKKAGVIFASLAASTLPLLRDAAQADAPVHVDLHDWDGISDWYRPFFDAGDVIQVAVENLTDPDATCLQLLRGRTAEVVLTKGGEGSVIYTSDQRVMISAAPADIVDTNGAGDTFGAAYMLARLDGANIETAGRYAAGAAALTVESSDLVPLDLPATDIATKAAQIR